MITPRLRAFACFGDYRHSHGGTVVGDHFYIGGGSGIAEPSFERYDPSTNTWSYLANMLQGTHDDPDGNSFTWAGAQWYNIFVGFNGKVYSLSGRQGAGDHGQCTVYIPADDTWRMIRPMPVAVVNAGAATDGQYIYAAGPYPLTTPTFKYDPAADVWTTLTAARSEAACCFSMTAAAGILYRVGGWASSFKQSAEKYDPNDGANGKWTALAPPNTLRGQEGIAAFYKASA